MRFPLSFRAVEEAMLLRGVQVSYETIRRRQGVPPWRIAGWLRRGLLPSWHGRQGRLVLVEDVRALAQQRAARLSAAEAATPLPADSLFIRDVMRFSGVTKDRIYVWMRRDLLPVWPGPGIGQRVRLADVLALMERPGRALPSCREREP